MASAGNRLDAVQHIVVLMMASRSFDHMLGFLYSGNVSPFDGLTGTESNPDSDGQAVTVFRIEPTTPNAYYMPGADPGEGYQATNDQLYGNNNGPSSVGHAATCQGFVANYAKTLSWESAQRASWPIVAGTVEGDIMGCFTPEALPVLSALAKGYAVCDQWFASVPTETMPNRAFACAATSQGHMDNKTHTFSSPTIFGLLDAAGLGWSVYGYAAEPLTKSMFTQISTAAASHFGRFTDFQAAAAAGVLPPFTFLEPSWGSSGNSQHPPYDVALGEQLIHDVYEALRTGPGWPGTLLVITYDQHGGLYDHVPPPWGAVPPDNAVGEFGFGFDRFGVRVPTVLVSPLIAPGTVFRVPDGRMPLDHTSILKTVEQRWNLPALTARDAAAPGFGEVLTLTRPRPDDVLAGGTVPVLSATGPAAATVELGTLGGADNDAVGTEDRLGFKDYVNAFADLITSPYTTPPLTIGIFGSWGMGKSFLLKHIEREISNRENPDRRAGESAPLSVHIVPFNAWEFSETELVWPGLVRKILKKLDEEVPWPWYKRWWTRLKWNLPREIQRRWVPLTVTALVAAIAIGVSFWKNRTDLAAVLIGAVSLLGVGSLLRAAINPVTQWVTTIFAEGNYGRQIGYMEDIKHDLETLEARLHVGGRADAEVLARILVLIDDLDRCEPDKAVEMLQAINLLLNFESFIICLGIDARIVSEAVEKHYEGLLGAAGASGYEYLDKIVQIPFRIPEPSEDDIKIFITKQLREPAPPVTTESEPDKGTAAPTTGDVSDGSSTSPVAAQSVPSTAAQVPTEGVASNSLITEPEASVPFTYTELQAFEAVTPFLRRNPRHLKRLINVYRLVRALARSKDDNLILTNPALTIRWLVMWSQWPCTAYTMLELYDKLFEQWGDKIEDHTTKGDPLPYLFNEATRWLGKETYDRFDDEHAKLGHLLAVTDSSLTWEDLRRIQKYTVNLNPAVEDQLSAITSEILDRDGRDVDTHEAGAASSASIRSNETGQR